MQPNAGCVFVIFMQRYDNVRVFHNACGNFTHFVNMDGKTNNSHMSNNQ